MIIGYRITFRNWGEELDRDLPYEPTIFPSEKEAWEALFKTLERAGNQISMLQKVELSAVVK